MLSALQQKTMFVFADGLLHLLLFLDFQTTKLVFRLKLIAKLCGLAGLLFVGGTIIKYEYKTKNFNIFLTNILYPEYKTWELAQLPLPKSGPIKHSFLDFPVVSSQAYLVVDAKSGKVLASKSADIPFAPASTTKLMTALVAQDIYSLDEVVTVPQICTTIDSQIIGLHTGEQVGVADLISSMLVGSAGDSACVLAYGKIAYQDFVLLMNQKAKDLGMQKTSFTNPIGFDDLVNGHISTAEDLYLLTKAALDNRLISMSVAKKEYVFNTHLVKTTNAALELIPGSVGVKTGTTAQAKQVLAYAYNRDNISLIIIIMGSLDRYADTKLLLNWILASYSF